MAICDMLTVIFPAPGLWYMYTFGNHYKPLHPVSMCLAYSIFNEVSQQRLHCILDALSERGAILWGIVRSVDGSNGKQSVATISSIFQAYFQASNGGPFLALLPDSLGCFRYKTNCQGWPRSGKSGKLFVLASGHVPASLPEDAPRRSLT